MDLEAEVQSRGTLLQHTQIATELTQWNSLATHGEAPEHWDPDIRIEKVTSVLPTNVNRTGAHHGRVPDIGLSIRAFIATGTATEHAVVTEYSGEYIGHGQSKTVFKLHCLRESGTFDGCILKVRKTERDLEPSVFTRLRDSGITTNILYQARGLEWSIDDFPRYHCWITEQAIPLDEFCQINYAVKSKCTLATFCCILRAAEHGLYLSDSHFLNFGVKITSDATEHTLVIIDAGSRGLDPVRWTKTQ